MNAAHFDEVRQLFDKLCDLPASAQRAALLESTSDARVVAEVEALLLAQTQTLQCVQRPLRAALQVSDGVLEAGTRLGPWRIDAHLASGGMGTVYRAERGDGHFALTVAVKLLHGVVDAAAQERLARERQILADLAHPDIARLLDGGATAGGQPYLVMEYVEGEPIDRYCASRRLDRRARIELFLRVCGAVEHAHRHLVVHCDLKPSNVLVRANGAPVLLDFGIARVLATGPGEEDGAGPLTPAYASPEQLAGQRVTTQSDVFSLGLILHELLLGRHRPETSAPATDASAAAPRLCGDLAAIVQRATAAVPAQRYASVAALADDLRRHLEHRPVQARRGGLLHRGALWCRRQWRLAAVLGLLFVLAAAFSLGLRRERDRALQAEHAATVQAQTAEQVSDFLVSVFEFANPAEHPRHDVTAREILDHGRQRIDGELDAQPRVKARLLYVLGRAYEMLGRGDEGAGLYRQSATLYGAAAPLDAARSLSQLAALQRNQGHLDDAATAIGEAIELRRGRVADDSLEMADSLNTRALIESSRGQFDAAAADYQRALSIRRAKLGENSDETAVTLHNLGLLQHYQGHETQAQQYYRQALRIKRALHGADHPETLITLRSLAASLSASGETAQAIELLQGAMVSAQHVYGENSPDVSTLHNELGSALHDQGRFAEAAAEYRRALAITAVLGRDGGADDVAPLNNLASALEDMGDFAAALPLYRQSLALRRQLYDERSASVARAEHNLGRALVKAGQLDEAAAPLDNALQKRRALLGDAAPETAKSQLMHAEWLRSGGHLDEAARAYADSERSPAVFSADMRAARARGLGLIALARGDHAQAQAQLQSAWTTLGQTWGEAHPLAAAAALDYARALRDAGQREQADALLRKAAPVVEAAFAPQSPQRQLLKQLQAR